MKRINEVEAITKFLLGELEELSEKHMLKYERVMKCDELIRQYYSMNKVVPILHKTFRYRYENNDISVRYTLSMAKRDYVDTKTIMGSGMKPNRDYQVDILLEKIARTQRLAETSKNVMAMAKCDSNHLAVIKELMSKDSAPDYANIPEILISFAPETLGIEEKVSEQELELEIQKLSKAPQQKLPEVSDQDVEPLNDY